MKLNQVVAIEKGVKQRAYQILTEANKLAQRADPFNGFVKTYQPNDAEGETYPAEQKRVQARVDEILKSVSRAIAEHLNLSAAKDVANCAARARVVAKLDGDEVVVIDDMPATFLLSLEKFLNDLRTFVGNLPELSQEEVWVPDPQNEALHVSQASKTHRTKKAQKALVMYPATPEHPAQTQLITEDIVVGYWTQFKFSGAISTSRKEAMLERVDTLARAVKTAREQANLQEAETFNIGSKIMNYLFNVE